MDETLFNWPNFWNVIYVSIQNLVVKNKFVFFWEKVNSNYNIEIFKKGLCPLFTILKYKIMLEELSCEILNKILFGLWLSN